MDLTALRVERVRQDLEGTKFAIELRARQHIAVLAVALTIGGSAAITGLGGQLGPAPAAAVVPAASAVTIQQIRALRELSGRWRLARGEAARATDRSIESEVNPMTMAKRPTKQELAAEMEPLRRVGRRLDRWSLWWPKAGSD